MPAAPSQVNKGLNDLAVADKDKANKARVCARDAAAQRLALCGDSPAPTGLLQVSVLRPLVTLMTRKQLKWFVCIIMKGEDLP